MSLTVSGFKCNHPGDQLYLLSGLLQRLSCQSVALTPLAALSRVHLPAFSLPGSEVSILLVNLPIPIRSFFLPTLPCLCLTPGRASGFRLARAASPPRPPSPPRGRVDEDHVKPPPMFPPGERRERITSRSVSRARLPTRSRGRGSDRTAPANRSPSAPGRPLRTRPGRCERKFDPSATGRARPRPVAHRRSRAESRQAEAPRTHRLLRRGRAVSWPPTVAMAQPQPQRPLTVSGFRGLPALKPCALRRGEGLGLSALETNVQRTRSLLLNQPRGDYKSRWAARLGLLEPGALRTVGADRGVSRGVV